jgi:hypothetical protein
MKRISPILSLFVFLTGLMAAVTAGAADEVSVLKIDTMVMEKGTDTYSLTVKAFVKNTGPADDIAIQVAALDAAGFEVANTTLSGPVGQGQTKVMVGVVKMPKTVFDQVAKWEWKK